MLLTFIGFFGRLFASLLAITPDFWATLLAGIIGALGAIGGVMLQRRFENKERLTENERQRKEVAKALAYEIEGIRNHYLVPLRDVLANVRHGAEHTVALKSPPANSFPIYHANAYRIGEFNGDEVDALIGFYNLAENFMAILVDAARAKHNLYAAIDVPRAQQAAGGLYNELREMIPSLMNLSQTATEVLTKRTK